MKLALDIIALLAAVCCGAPILLLLLETLAALMPIRRRDLTTKIRRGAIAILIPAHNEAGGIAETIASLAPQLAARDRVIVIADNCDDLTADLARRAGAEVMVRHDALRRGKGFALAAGVDYLRAAGPAVDIVIVFDADCRLSDGGLDVLAARVAQSGLPVQSSYRMVLSPGATIQDRISAFAFLVKCHVRSLGRERMHWPCHLMGTGMAFPWSIIQSLPLASADIVEDMALGLDLVLANQAAVFEPRATVTSAAAVGRKAALSQRKRWEHGHLQTIQEYVPRLIIHGLRHRQLNPMVMACDLAVPPLALLSIVWSLAQLLTFALLLFGGARLPALICAGAGAALLLSIFMSWARFARSMVPLTTLLLVPLYVFSKLPIYFGFLLGHRSSWTRTARAGESF